MPVKLVPMNAENMNIWHVAKIASHHVASVQRHAKAWLYNFIKNFALPVRLKNLAAGSAEFIKI
jgi:hypothetical protein